MARLQPCKETSTRATLDSAVGSGRVLHPIGLLMLVLLLLAVLASTALLLLARVIGRDGYRPAPFDPQYDSRGGGGA